MTRQVRGELRRLASTRCSGAVIFGILLFIGLGSPIYYRDGFGESSASELNIKLDSAIALGVCILFFSIGLVMVILPTRQSN